MSKLSFIETDHKVEKLEFALAISKSIGDKIKSDQIQNQLNKIGFNYEEPGT